MAVAEPVSLRERKKIATKDRLFREALQLFQQKGFAAATVEEIAAAAEVAKGTFFNYFPTKEAVFSYLGERQAQAAGQEIQAALADPQIDAREKMGRILSRLAATVEADRHLMRMAVFEAMKAPDVLAADPYRALFKRVVSSLLSEAQAHGQARAGLDPELVGSAIAGMYFQQVFEWCAAPAPYPLGEQLRRMVELLWEGIGTR